ncbi:cupin domain-containing protein [Desulfogranum japonicum]|uniref:cupin domain-containing protein n=1 Tax=Desulfogranum japonicum TaxID=231447 RepID=UPI00041A9F20|nr:cupin domain-containing protein [Desulfogranum japonicum]
MKQLAPGICIETLVAGDLTHMVKFHLSGGAELPVHSHPHEQTGYLLSGRITLCVGDTNIEAVPGDSWSIPGNIEHSAQVHEDSIALEIFSPVREDYLEE